MKDFLQFLIIYWKPIVGFLFTIIGFIIALVKKKPMTDIFTDIYDWSIRAVNLVEADSLINPDLKGDLKLSRAVSLVLSWIHDKYPTIDENRYFLAIQQIIEGLLSTPHKKG